MHDADLVARLARVGDLGVTQPTPAMRDRARRALLVEIDQEERALNRRPKSGRRRLAVVAVLGLAACSAGTVGYASLSSPNKASAGISCHLDAQQDGSQTIHALDGRSAISVCAEDWRTGVIGTRVRKVPSLQACVDPAGDKPIRVFPSSDPSFCYRMSMRSDPTAGAHPSDIRFVQFRRDIEALYSAQGDCTTERDARALIRAALDRHQMSDWSIKAAASLTASPTTCTGDPAIDSSAREVYLFPAR
jgi:hypothetical protein